MNVGVATAGAGDVVSDTTTQTFRKDVLEESRRQPVLVDFWAPWCGPCKQLTPVLEKAVRAAKGKARLVKMNIDEHPAIAGQMGIQSIPAVVAFVNGQAVDGFMGALPENQVIAFIERVTRQEIGGEEKEIIKAADDELAAGDPNLAAQGYAQVLAGDPENLQAVGGLARAFVKIGNLAEARRVLEGVPEAKRGDAAVAAARAAIEVAEQAANLGPLTDLERKVAADPLDHQARFDYAIALNADNRRPEALDQLLEIVRRDRQWNDDGARKQLVQFFEAWGPTDDNTIAGRRRLSSILFA